MTEKKSSKAAGKSLRDARFRVCCTGFIDKSEIQALVKAAGMRYTDAVSSLTDYLITEDMESDSRKMQAAEKHGTRVFTLPEFIEELGALVGSSAIQDVSVELLSDICEIGDNMEVPSGVFVAVDFETADYKHDSACAIGLVRVENGEVVAEEYRLIRPPRMKVTNSHIHGLHWKHLQDQPDFAQTWQGLSGFFDNADYFIAHNAVFDRRVMEASCGAYSIKPTTIPFLCTLLGAKTAVHVDSYRLPDLCEHFSIPFGQHHQALSDAKAALCLYECLHKSGIPIEAMRVSSAPKSSIETGIPKHSDEQDAVKEFRILAEALVCDEILNHDEFTFLCDWLTRHAHLAELPALSPVFELTAEIVADGIVTDDELDEMRQFLQSMK